MKGLELSERFFRECFLPRAAAAGLDPAPLAAGLAGEGSECFGYDDDLSRDHDWGAGFCLWLPEDIPEDYVHAAAGVLRALPTEYMGQPVKPMFGTGRCGMFTVGAFYARLLGCAAVPETNAGWLALREPSLAAATNGRVFLDNPGQFTALREQYLAYYPEDVRRYRMAQAAAQAAQAGQYNYLRCFRRGDTLAALSARESFISAAAQLVFLLNRRYRPYYKWTFRALGELPLLGSESLSLLQHFAAAEGEAAAELAEALSSLLATQLRQAGLSAAAGDFLMDHAGELLLRIEDEALRHKPLDLIR